MYMQKYVPKAAAMHQAERVQGPYCGPEGGVFLDSMPGMITRRAERGSETTIKSPSGPDGGPFVNRAN
jgi:hypothetical protein